MAKNLIPEIARMLGVEIGEEFRIKGYGELICTITDDKGLMAADDSSETGWIPANALFAVLLKGKDEIVKLPWCPKKDEGYYTFGTSAGTWMVWQQRWTNHPVDLALLGKGWIYRTRAEAEAALPKMAAEMGVEYEM